MKISIIIPTYNREQYLIKLLDSIIDQNYKNYEIIIVDDGSTDNSMLIIGKYKKYNNVYIYSKKNEGPGIARKYGFQKAQGDLIFFIDSDDWLPNKNVLSDIIKIFDENNPDLLIFDRELYCHDKKMGIVPPLIYKKINSGLYSSEILENCYIRGGLGLKVFKRNLLDLKDFYNSKNYEDFYTTYMYINKCHTIFYYNKSLYSINVDNNKKSLSNFISLENDLIAFEVINNLNDKIQEKFLLNSISILAYETYSNYIFRLFKFKYKKNEIKLIFQNKERIKKIKKIIKDNHIKIKTNFIKKMIVQFFIHF